MVERVWGFLFDVPYGWSVYRCCKLLYAYRVPSMATETFCMNPNSMQFILACKLKPYSLKSGRDISLSKLRTRAAKPSNLFEMLIQTNSHRAGSDNICSFDKRRRVNQVTIRKVIKGCNGGNVDSISSLGTSESKVH